MMSWLPGGQMLLRFFPVFSWDFFLWCCEISSSRVSLFIPKVSWIWMPSVCLSIPSLIAPESVSSGVINRVRCPKRCAHSIYKSDFVMRYVSLWTNAGDGGERRGYSGWDMAGLLVIMLLIYYWRAFFGGDLLGMVSRNRFIFSYLSFVFFVLYL